MQTALQLAEPAKAHAPAVWTPKLVIWVVVTGLDGSRLRTLNLYDPPLDQALRAILREVNAHAGDVGLIRCNDAREPPCLHGALAVVSFNADGGRWPLAYLTAAVGDLDHDAIRKAFLAIGGRP